MKQIIPNLWEIDEIGEMVHCYLWEWAAGVTLIDTGNPGCAPQILAALAKRGYAPHHLRRIIITHVDLDHTGSLAALKKATGAKVVCHVVEKQALEEPWRRQPAAWFLRPLLALVTLMPAFRQTPVTPDELVVDGQELPEGFTVVHTPGHSPGHISLLHRERRLLITGDAISNRNNQLRDPTYLYTPDTKNAQRSIWKLAKKYGDDFETIVFGHGPPILQHGGQRVRTLVSRIYPAEV